MSTFDAEYPIFVIHRNGRKDKRVHATMRDLELSYAVSHVMDISYELNGTDIPEFTYDQRRMFERSRDHSYVWYHLLEANVPYAIIFEDDTIVANRDTNRDRFDTVMKENGIEGKSDSLSMSTEILCLGEGFNAYGISNYAMRTILNNHPDPHELFRMLEEQNLPEDLTVRKASPPLFKPAPRSLHIFWVILAIALIILAFVWVNRERPSRIDSNFRGLLPMQDFGQENW